MRQPFRPFARHDGGATSVEYGLIAVLVGLALMLGMRGVAPTMELSFARLVAAIGGGNVVVVVHEH